MIVFAFADQKSKFFCFFLSEMSRKFKKKLYLCTANQKSVLKYE